MYYKVIKYNWRLMAKLLAAMKDLMHTALFKNPLKQQCKYSSYYLKHII